MALFVENLKLRLFALAKIPLIFFCRPQILKVDSESVLVKIPLRHRTRNHVHSMYFGALSVGADLSIGLLATHQIQKSGKKIVLVFKDFKADFIKRAMDDVYFFSNEGAKVAELIEKVIATGERQNASIHGHAFTKKDGNEDIVAEFDLTLSLK